VLPGSQSGQFGCVLGGSKLWHLFFHGGLLQYRAPGSEDGASQATGADSIAQFEDSIRKDNYELIQLRQTVRAAQNQNQ